MEEDLPTQETRLEKSINHSRESDIVDKFMTCDSFHSNDPSIDSLTSDVLDEFMTCDSFHSNNPSIDSLTSDVLDDRIYNYFDSFPTGYRFQPHDHELIVYYLKKKVLDETLPPHRIHDVNLSHHNPETLTANFKQHREKAWYFFTPRDRKYPNGDRPSRSAGDGYWKATSADNPIKFNGRTVGFKRSLAFCLRKATDVIKTPWIMQEYKLPADKRRQTKGAGNDMTLDAWVLCKIYKNETKSKGTKPTGSVVHEVQAQQDHDAEHVPAEMNNVDNQNGEPMPLDPMPNDLHHETNNGYNPMGDELKPFPKCYDFNRDSSHINYCNPFMPIKARPPMNLPFDDSMGSNVGLNQCPSVNGEERFKFPTMGEGESFLSQFDFSYPGDMGSIFLDKSINHDD